MAPINGNTDYDAQLGHVLKELHSSEGRALKQLNAAKTDQDAAIGASMYERAEGYNGRTGVDNFTATTAAAMAKIVGGSKDGVTQKDVAPKGLPTGGLPGLPTFTMPSTPPVGLGAGAGVNITIQQGDTNVSGVSDPHRAAEHVGTVAGYRNSDLIRNLQSSLA